MDGSFWLLLGAVWVLGGLVVWVILVRLGLAFKPRMARGEGVARVTAPRRPIAHAAAHRDAVVRKPASHPPSC
jgi:hypothetical protein